MKTLCALLLLTLFPVGPKAETVSGEAVTVLEIDTICWHDAWINTGWVDTLSHSFILPEWLVALKPEPDTAPNPCPERAWCGHYHSEPCCPPGYHAEIVAIVAIYPGQPEWECVPDGGPSLDDFGIDTSEWLIVDSIYYPEPILDSLLHRVDTVRLVDTVWLCPRVDTVWLCPRVDTTWYPGRIEWLLISPTNPDAEKEG